MKLLSFCLLLFVTIFNAYSSKAQLTSTNLPIVIITTSGAINTSQIQGNISIIDNASGVNTPTDPPKYSGMIGINVRGNTTYPKSSYSVETWSSPTVSLDTSLLGMPSENDWVLISSYEDRSLMRNTLSLRLHEQMGRYASRQRYCELIVNTQYAGIYTFGEKIKRDTLRLDLADLNNIDVSGEELTGGYIIKIDGNSTGWTSVFAPPYGTTQEIKFEFEYPSANDIVPVQEAYIESYVDSFEAALNATNFQDTTLGWRRFGAENSFIDFMIMQEVSRNNEAYRKNTFLYKDKGTKLRPGPLWSHEIAWRNTADCNSSKDTGWCYNYGATCGTDGKLPAFWWQKLTTDVSFLEALKCRYKNFRMSGQALDTVKIFGFIDSINTYLNANNAITRNFAKWSIWGVPIVNEPTPMANNYNEEVSSLKQFIRNRLAWLDTKWMSTSPTCFPVAVNNIAYAQQVVIYPNPSSDIIHLKFEQINRLANTVKLSDMQGHLIHSFTTTDENAQVNLSHLAKGIYLIQVSSSQGVFTKKMVKE